MKLAKTCNNPGLEDYKKLLHLMGYLRKYQRFAIEYYPDPEDSPVHKICKEHEINLLK